MSALLADAPRALTQLAPVHAPLRAHALTEMAAVAAVETPPRAEMTLLRFITCGSVDDGKSTLIGRLMHEAGVVPDDQLAALHRDSKKFGTTAGAVDYALLVDGLAAEREQGITIDVAYRYFATARRAFIVADTPGHEQYTRNMATGASTADLAVILVDARKGLLPQTRRHSFIVALMGVRHIVVAVNKMDLVGYDAVLFARLEENYRRAVAPLGFASIAVIPVSAREGDNITRRSNHMPWHAGPALLPLLEEIAVVSRASTADGFILPVQWVNRASADFRGYTGMVARGIARAGAEVVALPSGRRSAIARIVTADGDVDAASPEQSVTVTLTSEIDISRGDVLASPATRPRVGRRATARLLWTGDEPTAPGRDYLIRLGAATAGATIIQIHSILDVESFEAKSAGTLAANDIGVVALSFDRPLVLADFADSAELGGFILIDRLSNATVAFGFVASDALKWSVAGRGGRARVTQVINRALGGSGSDARQRHLQDLSWRILSAAIVAAVALWATQRLAVAIALGLADLTLRPALRRAHAAMWKRQSAARRQAEYNESGGGI